ncbi:hypothetical protein HOK51_06785 [Candidatus Woesearchaeota archaeon]|jgi:hypothetical protein|nr:hypothetical protein [Candidatus Woesearchaeota archaeon]MBT6519528.1 hypothetical protein [Candidatus Woesearchaeota archaeon]MBT7367727.1 hypothetical protein [Candidatus Woesearchaeota archaeon]
MVAKPKKPKTSPSSTSQDMLWILGLFLRESDRRFAKFPLGVSISKVEFIESIVKLKVTNKQERAIYKNLEELEKRKFIIYKNRELCLSKKGFTKFSKQLGEFNAKKTMEKILSPSNIAKTSRGKQTKLRN